MSPLEVMIVKFVIIFLLILVQIILTPTHLAIVMEYASGGELFERICNAGRFSEDEVQMPNCAFMS